MLFYVGLCKYFEKVLRLCSECCFSSVVINACMCY